MYSLEKVAKQLSLWQNLTENLRPSALTELSYEFREKMGKLRTYDETIRDLAESLPDYIKSAEKNWNRNEFFEANKDLELFVKQLNNIKNNLFAIRSLKFLNSALKEFVGRFSPQDKDRIESLFKRKLDKQAGVTDWFFRNFTERGRSLKQFVKKFPKTFGNLKIAQKSLIDNAKSLLKNFELQLSRLATFRVKRQVEDYQALSEILIKQFYKFEMSFQKYWDGIVSPLLSQLNEFSPKTEPIPSKPESKEPKELKQEEKKPDPTPIDSLEFGKDPVVIPSPKSPSIVPQEPVVVEETKTKSIIPEAPKELGPEIIAPVVPQKPLSKKERQLQEEAELEKLRDAIEKDKLLKGYDEAKEKEEQAKIEAEILKKQQEQDAREKARKEKIEAKRKAREEEKLKRQPKSLSEISQKFKEKYTGDKK